MGTDEDDDTPISGSVSALSIEDVVKQASVDPNFKQALLDRILRLD